MSIRIGDRIPDAQLMTASARSLETAELFGGKRVLLFALPGAFTPTCNDTHLPGYQLRAQEILETGVDTIACVAVNDVHVMSAWSKALNVGDAVLMLSDGSGHFTRALGLELDLMDFGLGMRSQRYAALVDDGVVTMLEVEPGPGVTVSAAESMLSALRSRVT